MVRVSFVCTLTNFTDNFTRQSGYYEAIRIGFMLLPLYHNISSISTYHFVFDNYYSVFNDFTAICNFEGIGQIFLKILNVRIIVYKRSNKETKSTLFCCFCFSSSGNPILKNLIFDDLDFSEVLLSCTFFLVC